MTPRFIPAAVAYLSEKLINMFLLLPESQDDEVEGKELSETHKYDT